MIAKGGSLHENLISHQVPAASVVDQGQTLTFPVRIDDDWGEFLVQED